MRGKQYESRQLTEKQKVFLEHLFDEDNPGDLKFAMKMAGYSPADEGALIRALKDEILDRAEMLLAANAPKAAISLIFTIEDGSREGARNSLAAAKELLDRVGIVKTDKVEVGGPDGSALVILPAKNQTE